MQRRNFLGLVAAAPAASSLSVACSSSEPLFLVSASFEGSPRVRGEVAWGETLAAEVSDDVDRARWFEASEREPEFHLLVASEEGVRERAIEWGNFVLEFVEETLEEGRRRIEELSPGYRMVVSLRLDDMWDGDCTVCWVRGDVEVVGGVVCSLESAVAGIEEVLLDLFERENAIMLTRLRERVGDVAGLDEGDCARRITWWREGYPGVGASGVVWAAVTDRAIRSRLV
jgi:hypothetical protein